VAEGCRFEAHVFRCTCVEQGQLHRFYEVTQPENCSRLEFRWLSSGAESVQVFWTTVWFSHIKNVRRFTTHRIVTCWKTSLGESSDISYMVPILAYNDFCVVVFWMKHLSGHRFTCGKDAKHPSVTLLRQQKHRAHTSAMDKLIVR